MNSNQVKIGIVGTSWWADAMYLPALKNHPQAHVAAVCGRDPERTAAFAEQWEIPAAYTDYQEMMAEADLDAVIIATANDTHYPITMAALEKNLHILCEKPLAIDTSQAQEMAAAAAAAGVITLVPFTYRFMPTNRYLKQLIDEGYIGQPYHLSLRYYASYGRGGNYMWRFDKAKAGSGVIGDLGSHFLYLARWYFGEITAITCQSGQLVQRPDLDPDGQPYEKLEDSAMFLLEFANGAQGIVHASCVAHEETQFGQRHFMEFHGADGTLYMETDWNNKQIVRGAQAPQGELQQLPIPDAIWGKARRDNVHETYKDVFRQDLLMIGEWVTAVAEKRPASPDFADGLAIQRLIDAAVESARSGCRVIINQSNQSN